MSVTACKGEKMWKKSKKNRYGSNNFLNMPQITFAFFAAYLLTKCIWTTLMDREAINCIRWSIMISNSQYRRTKNAVVNLHSSYNAVSDYNEV